MFNRKPNWRAGIVGLASLALLATFPLATVTASAETVEPTPAGTVEQVATAESPEVDLKKLSAKADAPEGVSVERAASGYNAFRMAGQDRSADPEITGRKPLPSGTLWSLGEHGELVKTVWEKNKYVPKESRDIPYGSVQCGSPYNGRNRDSQFDGLAVSNDGNTMYALSGFLGLPSNDGRSAGTSIYRYHNGGWSTYSLSWVSDYKWKISEKPLSWGPCNDGWKSANYTSENRNDRYNQKSYKHTFAHSMTQFTSGAMVNVDGKEYYIFGGYNTTKNHSQPQTIKFFAFDPSAKTVDYLGFVPTVSGKDHSFTNSDFTVDEDGHLYFSQSSKSGESAATVKIRRINSGTLKSLIRNRGNFRFSGNGSDGWDDRFEPKPGYLNSHSGSRDWAITVDSNFSFSTVVSASDLNDSNHSYTNVDVFAGFDFDPSGNVALSFNGSKGSTGPSSGASYNPEGANGGSSGSEVVVLYDKQGNKVKNYKPFYYPVAGNSASGVIHQKTGGYGNIFNHDIVGSPFSVQPRSFKLFKKLESRYNSTDEFNVGLNVNSRNMTGISYKKTNQRTGRFQIGDTNSNITNDDLVLTFTEQPTSGSLSNYDTTLECVTVKMVEGKRHEDTINLVSPELKTATSGQWDYKATIPSSVVGDIECTIINKAKVPSAKVTVYKNFKSRDDQHYRYSVGFSNGSSEHSSVTGWQTLNADTAMRDATDIDVPVGASIKVFEKDTQSALDLGGSLNKYTVNIACYNGVRRDEQNRIGSVAGTELNLTVPAPKLASKKISCYVDNALTPKDKTVTLYKKFDRRYKNSDNFKVFAEVPLSYPINKAEGQTNNTIYPNASATTPLAYKVFKKDATITVGEQGIDGASLDNYDTDVKCTEGGFNGRALPVAATQGRSKQFNLSNTTSSTVDCYVINKARKKVTIHKNFNRRFANNDNFTVTATNTRNTQQTVSGTTTGTGTDNQGMNDFGPKSFSSNARLKVTETGVGSTDLSHYNTSIKCTVDGPNGASINPVGQETSTRTSYFDLSNVTSPVVDCYVTNTVPEPERTITVKKIFKNDTTTDGFGISGWFGDNSHSFNMQNTSGHTHDEVFTVSKRPIKVNSGALTAVFSEAARPDRHINLYSISVVCKGEGADPDLENITDGKTVKITGTTNGNRWDARGTIPANLTGAITCTITNELPKPKLTTVTLYKQLHRFNSGDQFNIGLYDAQTSAALSGASVNTSTVDNPEHLTNVAPSNKDYDQYVVGEHQFTQSADGFKFTVKEWATDSAKLSNYNLNLFCQHYQNGSWADFRATLDNVQNLQNGISVDVKVPAGVTGQVHCYLQNTAKPKVKVVLYKDLKRADTTDQFNVGMSKPGATGNTWDSVISPVQANNSNLTETSHYAVDAGYSRYQIGSYEYARDDETGFNFKVEETANDTDVLSKYTSNLTCKYVSNGSENTDAVTNVSEPQDNNGTRSISGVIPAGTTDAVVHCYLTNSPKPKAENKLVLFKQLKRVNSNDQFYFGLYNPSTSSFSTPLGGVYPKTTGSTSTTHSTVELEYDGKTVSYDQYKSDDYKYSDSENGFTFKISESRKEAPTKVSDYVSSVTCKALDAAGQWSKINVSFGEIVTNGNTRYVVATLPAHQSGEVHCYLRNEPKPKPKTGSITIHKISSIGGSDLSGSHWKVQQRIGNSGPFKDYGVIADDDTTTVNQLHDADNRPGYIKIDNLKIGTELEPVYYRVIETVAPAGFILPTKESSRTHSFTLYPGKAFGKDAQYREKEVQNTPATSPELPFTGGWGTLPYMILGFVLTGGAVVAFVIAKPKNTKPSHK